MIKRSFFLLSTATFFFWGVNVSIASDSFNTHTQHTPIELKPASFLDLDHAYKTASVCFLGNGNCGSDGGFNKADDSMYLNTSNQCKQEGFQLFCKLPFFAGAECPYNSNYNLCVKDIDRACYESGYRIDGTCPSGRISDYTLPCPFDEGNKEYFICTCAPCHGFDYTYEEATADGYVIAGRAEGRCLSCETTKYKRKCNPCDGYTYTYEQATAEGYVVDESCKSCDTTMYKRKENPCSGFSTCECGGEIGAKICYSGNVKKFDKCKSCCENKCTLKECLPNGYCSLEPCSEKYCFIACNYNYTEWCSTPITDCAILGYTKTISQCPDGYLKCPYGDGVFCETY